MVKKPPANVGSEVGDQLFEEGERALAEHRFREAVEAFQAAVVHLPTKQWLGE